jgi:hydroxyethylthiazole kinase-like uncharacterized protein yjeF
VPALPIYLTEDIRRIEECAAEQDTPPELMERAGLAAAELARERFLDGGRSVLVIAGPGNNGGDGFVLARHLKQWWYQVCVVFTGDRSKLSADAAAAYDAWLAAGGQIDTEVPRNARFDLVVDALFGIGLERDITGRYAQLIETINGQPQPVLSLDIPSGLHADSGRVLGCCVRATSTVTFIAFKPGLLTLDGPDYAGDVRVSDLGLEVDTLLPARGRVIDRAILAEALRPRPRNSHKGTYGNVIVIGGAFGMTGAALLAGRAALKLGAGRVYLGLLGADAPRLDPGQPELMLRNATDVLDMDHQACMVVGPGMGQSDDARAALRHALAREIPIVLDADALNLLGADAELQQMCGRRTAPTLLTPHPAEAARLLQSSTSTVQRNRVAAALQLADRYRACVALKGVGTVCGHPSGEWHINTSGNPGLASAGMGDVLSGLLGALLAQGTVAPTAMLAGVYLHGAAADSLLEVQGGPVGMTGTEVMDAARSILNRAVYTSSS